MVRLSLFSLLIFSYFLLSPRLFLVYSFISSALTETIFRKTLLRDQVRITETQVKAGTVPYSNLLSVQSQLATTEATQPPLQQKLSQTEHLLATLAGRAPTEWTAPEVDLGDLKLPGNLPISLPSEGGGWWNAQEKVPGGL